MNSFVSDRYVTDRIHEKACMRINHALLWQPTSGKGFSHAPNVPVAVVGEVDHRVLVRSRLVVDPELVVLRERVRHVHSHLACHVGKSTARRMKWGCRRGG